MPFDPNAPFEAVAAPDKKPAFDPAQPFDPVDKPAFDPSQPHDGFDDPVAHYASDPSPETLTAAREAFKLNAAQPTDYLKAAGNFAKGAIPALGTGIVSMAKGIGHAVANVGIELTEPEGSPEAQRAQRENAAAIQLGAMQGGDTVNGIGRNVQRLFGKTDRTLSDKEIEDQIQHEAAHRAVAQSLTQGNVVEGGIGEPFGFGSVERKDQTPEQLAAAGAPVSPQAVQNESFLGDPSTYAIAPVAELAGPLIGKTVTGPILSAAGATVSGAGKAVDAVLGHSRGVLGGLAYSLYSHDPIGAVGGFSAEMAAKHVAPAIGSALSEAGAEAAGNTLPPVGQGLVKKAFKAGATGAVTGGALSLPFVAAAQTPEEAGQAFGGGLGIGGTLGITGGVTGSRATDTAAKFGQLSREGAAIQYGLGWDQANATGMAQLDPATQDVVNAYRGRYNGKTDANGMPIQIYTVAGQDYARALQENGGGQATDTRGFISPDGTKIFLNADAATSAEKTAETLGHEAGGHLTEFLADISQAHDIAELRNSMRDALYENGKPTPQFSAFMRNYANSLAKGGASTSDISKLDNQYFEKEFLAQHAAKILGGESIANFNLPKPITERITRGASDWLQNQGIVKKTGGEIGWGANEIKGITGQFRDLLYKQGQESEQARTARATDESASPSANYRLKQLETLLATPPTGASTVDEVKAYQAAQREYDGLNSTLNPQAAPVTPSAPQGNAKALADARVEARTGLKAMGYTPTQINQWINQAYQQHGSPIEDTASLVRAVLKLSRGETIKPGEFTPKPATPPTPTTPITAPTGDKATFRDEQRNAKTITGLTPDEVARLVQDRGHGDGTPGAMFAEITKAIEGRTRLRDQQAAEENRQKSEAKTTPQDEQAPPASNEPLPTEHGGTVVSAPGGVETPPPVPLPESPDVGDFDRIAAQARETFLSDKEPAKAGKNKGQHTKENQRKADKAAFDAAADAHAATVPLNYEGMRLRTDGFGKRTVSGTIDPSRPFDAWLIQRARASGNLPRESLNNLMALQDAIGTTVSYDYGHAPVSDEGDMPTNTGRAGQQAEHTVAKRLSGESPQQVTRKNSVPLRVGFNSGADSFTVYGVSQEKLLNNFNHLSEKMGDLEMPLPFRDINDPRFVAAFKNVIANHENGWKGDGSAPAVPTQDFPFTPNPEWRNAPEHQIVPKEQFEFINALLGDESMKSGSPEAKAKAHLANENEMAYDPTGETNELRYRINAATPPVDGKTWSKATIEDPLNENISPALVSDIGPASQDDESIRQHGKVGDLGRFFPKGKTPNRAFTSAAFMPSEEGPALDESDPAWIQRFEQLSQKEYRSKLTPKEDDELDDLHQQIVKQFGSLSAYQKTRDAEGETDIHEPLRSEMRKTPQQRAQERLQGRFMPQEDAKEPLTPELFLANLRNANRDATTDPQDARRAIASLLRGNDEAGQSGQGEAGREAQKKAVTDWARSNGMLLDKLPNGFDSNSDRNVGGVEHDVWADAPSQRFVKVTKPSFGVYPDLLVRREFDPSLPGPSKWERKVDWTLSKSSPLQYLEKLDGLSKFSGIDTRIEGVLLDGKGNPSFVTSQPEIQGKDISDSDVERRMKESGFLKIDDNTASYYRPSDNFAALDAHAGNMVERDGKLVAFDGVFIHPSGELKSILEQQYAEASRRKAAPKNSGSFLDAAREVMTPEKSAVNFMPDTGTPEEGNTPGERLAREAEQAGVVLNVATLKGLIQQDEETMNRVRARIQQNTGRPARFMPEDDAGYRGEHSAPMRDSGSPLYNLTPTYPDDIYSGNAAQYYGHWGDYRDRNSISIIQSFRYRPNAEITIFRAIPKDITNDDKISSITKQKAYIQRTGKIPPNVDTSLNPSNYYNQIAQELGKLQALPPEEKKESPKINVGDWVTIDRNYAKEHGESTLNGNFKIISKKVAARDIFTNGDSIHEWGYDPQPRVKSDRVQRIESEKQPPSFLPATSPTGSPPAPRAPESAPSSPALSGVNSSRDDKRKLDVRELARQRMREREYAH